MKTIMQFIGVLASSAAVLFFFIHSGRQLGINDLGTGILSGFITLMCFGVLFRFTFLSKTNNEDQL